MSKIPLPNYTQLPNVIMDTIGELSESELKVILLVCRRTFGFHRQSSEKMTINYFCKVLKLSRSPVCKALKSLTDDRQWLRKQKIGLSFEYFINLEAIASDFEELKKATSSESRPIETSSESRPKTSPECELKTSLDSEPENQKPVQNLDRKPVQNLDTIKETRSKETRSKKTREKESAIAQEKSEPSLSQNPIADEVIEAEIVESGSQQSISNSGNDSAIQVSALSENLGRDDFSAAAPLPKNWREFYERNNRPPWRSQDGQITPQMIEAYRQTGWNEKMGRSIYDRADGKPNLFGIKKTLRLLDVSALQSGYSLLCEATAQLSDLWDAAIEIDGSNVVRLSQLSDANRKGIKRQASILNAIAHL